MKKLLLALLLLTGLKSEAQNAYCFPPLWKPCFDSATKFDTNTVHQTNTGSTIQDIQNWALDLTASIPHWIRYWSPAGSGSAWRLTGNSGTTVGTNFLGTTDAAALEFKVNNGKSGWIDYISPYNTYFGYQTGNVVTGNHNTGVGYQSQNALTSGSYNSTYGANSSLHLTTGWFNTSYGYGSLNSIVTASSNTAFGSDAGNATTGNANTFVGDSAGANQTIGANNNYFGYGSGINNISLSNQTYIGDSTGNLTVKFHGALMPQYSGNYNAGTSGQVLWSQGAGVSPQWTSSFEPTLPSTFIGYGSAGNVLTGSSNFRILNSNKLFDIGNLSGRVMQVLADPIGTLFPFFEVGDIDNDYNSTLLTVADSLGQMVLYSTKQTSNTGFVIQQNSVFQPCRLTFKRSRGTASSPVKVNSGDTLFSIRGQGYAGSAYATGSDSRSIVQKTSSSNSIADKYVISTSSTVSGQTDRLVIDSAGIITTSAYGTGVVQSSSSGVLSSSLALPAKTTIPVYASAHTTTTIGDLHYTVVAGDSSLNTSVKTSGSDQVDSINMSPIGWNVSPAGFSASVVSLAQYAQVGKLVKCIVNLSGTSNSTTFTINAPFPALATDTNAGGGTGFDAGVGNNVTVRTLINSSTCTLMKGNNGSAFTGSGKKAAWVHFEYFRK